MHSILFYSKIASKTNGTGKYFTYGKIVFAIFNNLRKDHFRRSNANLAHILNKNKEINKNGIDVD